MIKRILAIVLSITVSGFPALAAGQSAGQITALIPSATRNAQPTKAKDTLQWNDLLQTAQSGRVRAGLTDGSILSLGSNSQLRVVQHDASSQQTSLEMNYGKLRSRVVKITQPNGKFEVKTPNAVIGVVGTDVFVGFENGLTTVACYTGKVTVTAQSGANVLKKSDQASSSGQGQVTLGPGQMVVVGLKVPAAGFPPEPEVIHASMLDTNINPHILFVAPKIWIPVVGGIVGGGIAGGWIATHGGSPAAAPVIPAPVTCGAIGGIKCGK